MRHIYNLERDILRSEEEEWRIAERARKRERWEWSILDDSRILFASILGFLLYKDHSLFLFLFFNVLVSIWNFISHFFLFFISLFFILLFLCFAVSIFSLSFTSFFMFHLSLFLSLLIFFFIEYIRLFYSFRLFMSSSCDSSALSHPRILLCLLFGTITYKIGILCNRDS